MKRMLLSLVAGIVLIIFVAQIAGAWGSWGHKHINRSAVFALPDSMRTFYYNHIDYITESAVVPDLRRPLLNDKAEGPRHFLDVEDFKSPITDLPKTPKEAFAEYPQPLLNKSGILPWYIQQLMDKLTTAFKKRNKSDILFLSSELAHYIGDAHVPLHLTRNYDGQLTGQNGIHALWESVLPPIFGGSFSFKTKKPEYIADITDYTWQMVQHTYSLIPEVLKADMTVRNQFDPTNDMYKKDSSGKQVLRYGKPVYSDAYATAFEAQLGDMIETQLRSSIYDITCYWFTAWVDAGKPDLINLDDPHLTQQNRRNFKKEYNAWKKGKLLNLGR